MFKEYWQHRRDRDRRGDYSFKKHLARLRREGRLPQIGLGALVVVLVAGVTFGKCESSITGPTEDAVSTTTPSGSLVPASDPIFEFNEKTVQRKVVFTGVNPCNGDAVRLEGDRYENIRITAAVGYFSSHHRIRDWCMRGFAIGNPQQKYTGRDEHEYTLKITTAGVNEEFETWEELKAIGPEPDWRMKFYQRYRARFDDPLNMRVEFRAKASCDHDCVLPGGCIEREFTLVSADEVPISALPVSPPDDH